LNTLNMRLPYTHHLRIRDFSVDLLDDLAGEPFCFFLDSAGSIGGGGRYSFFGTAPVKIFTSRGGLITIDGRQFIGSPAEELKRFESLAASLPGDPYLPFSGGIVGFLGHGWPDGIGGEHDFFEMPDAWFGIYDTVLTFDHMEGSCWISSFGINDAGVPDIGTARRKCESLEARLIRPKDGKRYTMKPLTPEAVSSFKKDDYISAVEAAKTSIQKKVWQSASIAQRFHAPVAADSWSIHKLLRRKNEAPYASFLRCGGFDVLSSSPSCFLRFKGGKITCDIVQKGIPKDPDPTKDKMNREEALHNARTSNPIVLNDETSLAMVTKGRPTEHPPVFLGDARSHYIISRIEGIAKKGCTAVDCISAILPAASMTGTPKAAVNEWLKKAEPVKRHIYTGSMGYIDTSGNAQFNHAVRTMITQDNVAFVHAGSQVERTTDAEEVFIGTKSVIDGLFEEIRGLGC